MIQANIVVTEEMAKRGMGVYRTHSDSIKEKMDAYLFAEGEMKHIDNDFKTSYLSSLWVKAQNRAKYEFNPDIMNHSGLALSHYTHFTSPIRRYADLMVHRILLGLVGDDLDIQVICNHCSEREKLSEQVENEIISLYNVPQIKSYDAIMVSANKCFAGFYIPELGIDHSLCSLHISNLLPKARYGLIVSDEGKFKGFGCVGE